MPPSRRIDASSSRRSVTATGGLVLGAALLGLAAGIVTVRLALRSTRAAALRVRE